MSAAAVKGVSAAKRDVGMAAKRGAFGWFLLQRGHGFLKPTFLVTQMTSPYRPMQCSRPIFRLFVHLLFVFIILMIVLEYVLFLSTIWRWMNTRLHTQRQHVCSEALTCRTQVSAEKQMTCMLKNHWNNFREPQALLICSSFYKRNGPTAYLILFLCQIRNRPEFGVETCHWMKWGAGAS